MLFGVSFTARPGKEAELERVLSDLVVLRRVATHMGATLEAVFLQGSRFSQIFDLPAAEPTIARGKILQAFAEEDVQDFMQRFSPLLDDPFQPEDPTSFAAWLQRHKLRLVADARAPPSQQPTAAFTVHPPAAAAHGHSATAGYGAGPGQPTKSSSGAAAIGAGPR